MADSEGPLPPKRHWRIVVVATLSLLGVRGAVDLIADSTASLPILLSGPAAASQQAVRLNRAGLLTISTQLIAQTNSYRAGFGLTPLTANASLTAAAEGHSLDMAATLLFSHLGSDGSTLLQRCQAAGYPGTYIGENIAAGQPDLTAALAAWINSPPHQVSLVNPLFDQIGVAGATSATGVIYWTMDLGSSTL